MDNFDQYQMNPLLVDYVSVNKLRNDNRNPMLGIAVVVILTQAGTNQSSQHGKIVLANIKAQWFLPQNGQITSATEHG